MPAAKPGILPGATATSTTVDLRSPTVLIVEDAPDQRYLLKTGLQRHGIAVDAVGSVAEALNVLDVEGAPRILLVDWVMADFSGLELVEALRRRGEADYVYCIMMSGLAERASIRKAFAAGADDYLVKPLVMSTVVERIALAESLLRLSVAPSHAMQFADRGVDVRDAS